MDHQFDTAMLAEFSALSDYTAGRIDKLSKVKGMGGTRAKLAVVDALLMSAPMLVIVHLHAEHRETLSQGEGLKIVTALGEVQGLLKDTLVNYLAKKYPAFAAAIKALTEMN